MRRISLTFLLFLPILICSCNIPNSITQENINSQEQTAIADYIQTAQAEIFDPTFTPTVFSLPTETPSPSPSLTPTATPEPSPTPDPKYFHGSLWYEPEFVSQEGLRYNGKLIDTGCTAASLQMVLDFWHDYKEDYPTLSAQGLIDRNVRQGQFSPSSGLNIMNTEDDLREMGYYLGTRQDSNKEELLAALERYGPLPVLTKVNWTPFGANHMAVITGYDPETDIIRVLDPWQTGGIMEFSYDSFDGIWSLNYLDDEVETLQRTFFFIVPVTELSADNAPFVPFRILQELPGNY